MKPDRFKITGTLFVALSVLAPTSEAKGPKPVKPTVAEIVLADGITMVERQRIRDWVALHQAGLPPGIARKANLPPGLRKQLAKSNQLPKGLVRQPLPDGLAANLPPRPAGQELVIIGPDIFLLDVKTGTILDILEGFLTLSAEERIHMTGVY